MTAYGPTLSLEPRLAAPPPPIRILLEQGFGSRNGSTVLGVSGPQQVQAQRSAAEPQHMCISISRQALHMLMQLCTLNLGRHGPETHCSRGH